MDIGLIEGGDSWQNWAFVVGYLGLTLFIIWRVLIAR